MRSKFIELKKSKKIKTEKRKEGGGGRSKERE